MISEVLTVGDLFMENDDWVNDEEASVFQRIEELIHEFKKDNNGKKPTMLYINQDEETQSYLMWFASNYGLKAEITTGVTHVG
tara:strand:+ start:1018 stop:1266 length:249 start_codon:yes stop_codon:yes gene_type:complete